MSIYKFLLRINKFYSLLVKYLYLYIIIDKLMVGSILQLAAKSVEDIPLSYKPEITLWKKVYRRHIEFSMEDKRLRFKSNLDFNKKSICRIRKMGDYVHKLFLELNITSPIIKYKILTSSLVKSILEDYEIKYNYNGKIDSSELINIDNIIKDAYNLFTIELDEIYNNGESTRLLEEIKTIKTNYLKNNISAYDFYEIILNEVIKGDSNYSIIYSFIKAYTNDKLKDVNSKTNNPYDILKLFYNELLKEVIIHDDEIYEYNILFIHNISSISTSLNPIDKGINSKTYFLNMISNFYSNIDEYNNLDCYKLYYNYLNDNIITLNSDEDVIYVKNAAYNSVFYGIFRNGLMIQQMYNNIFTNYSFIFYKKYSYTNYNKESFINLSLIDKSGATTIFNNDFDDNIKLIRLENEPSLSYYIQHEKIKKNINNFHLENSKIYKNENIESFFLLKHLWNFLSIYDNGFSTDVNLKPVNMLNITPYYIPDEILKVINTVTDNILSTYGITGQNIINFKKYSEKYFTSLAFYINEQLDKTKTTIFSTELLNKFIEINKVYTELPDDSFLTSILQKDPTLYEFNKKKYNVMEWIKKNFFDFYYKSATEFNNELFNGANDSNMFFINTTINDYGSITTKTNLTLKFNNSNPQILFSTDNCNFFIIYSDNDKYCVWFNPNGTTLEPNIFRHPDIDVSTIMLEINVPNNITDLLNNIKTELDPYFTISINYGIHELYIENNNNGYNTPIYTGDLPLIYKKIFINSLSSAISKSQVNYTFKDGNLYSQHGESNYFTLYSANNEKRIIVWLNTGLGTPTIPSYATHDLEVPILLTDTDIIIASKIKAEINAVYSADFTITNTGNTLEIVNNNIGFTDSYPLEVGDIQGSTFIFDSIDMFFIDVRNYHYNDYNNNGKSFFQLKRGRISLDIYSSLTSATITPFTIDYASSIWYTILTYMINNFNNLYNYDLLSNNFINNTFGSNLNENNTYIKNNFFSDYEEDGYFNYYNAGYDNTIQINANNYGNSIILQNQNRILFYLKNKSILNIKNLKFSENYIFKTYEDIYDYIINIIYASYNEITESLSIPNPSYYHDPSEISMKNINNILTTTTSLINYNEVGIRGVEDFLNDIKKFYSVYFDTSNTIGSLTPNFSLENEFKNFGITITDNLNDSYNTYIKNLTSFERTEQELLFKTFIDEITHTSFLTNKFKISNNYNNFKYEENLYNYIIDLILSSSYAKNYLDILDSSKINIYNNFINKLTNRINSLLKYINKIDGVDTTSLFSDIETLYNNQNNDAPFAWVEKLGHAIIKKAYVDIGGQIPETHTGKLMDIISEKLDSESQLKMLNKLIGNLPELQVYNTNKKDVKLIIPLRFFFCRRIESSLPHIAMHNTYTDIHIELEELMNVLYTENNTYFKRKPIVRGSLLTKYIYVSTEEREKMVNGRMEILIDPYNISSTDIINQNSINTNNYFTISPVFKGMCKEIFFTAQNSKYINNTLPIITSETIMENNIITTKNNTISYKKINPLYYGINNDGSGVPIEEFRILFNAKIRENLKLGEYSGTVPYIGRHLNCRNLNIMYYPLCLYPRELQPSGHGTLNKIHRVDFDIFFKEEVIKDLIDNNNTMEINFYTHDQTFLRVMSGLAALAFY